MNLIPLIAGITLLLAILLFLIFRNRKSYKKARSQFRYFSHQESFDYALFDLRDKESYKKGHLPKAVHYPLEEVNYLPLEDMFIHIFVYSKKASESRIAAKFLSDKGYFNVYDLGNYSFWKEALEKGKGIHITPFAERVRTLRKKQEQA